MPAECTNVESGRESGRAVGPGLAGSSSPDKPEGLRRTKVRRESSPLADWRGRAAHRQWTLSIAVGQRSVAAHDNEFTGRTLRQRGLGHDA